MEENQRSSVEPQSRIRDAPHGRSRGASPGENRPVVLPHHGIGGHHGRVAEQRPGEHQDEPDNQGEVERAQPGHVEGAPPHLDPEQLRQFQQFQQFQDFLRFTEAQQQNGQNGQLVPGRNGGLVPGQGGGQLVPEQGGGLVPGGGFPPPGGPLQVAAPPQPPAPRPKIRAPRWLKRLAGKLLSAFLLLLVLLIAGKLAYNYFFPAPDNNEPVTQSGGGTYHTNEILSTNPFEAARQVYQQIAQGRPDRACGLFATATQQQFAVDMHFADCQQAVLALSKLVTDKTAYAGSLPFGSTDSLPDSSIRIDSCDFPISGGPALGVFTVTKVDNGQWLITGHEPGPTTCPASSSSPSTIPTTP
jgi:hypothetical protein